MQKRCLMRIFTFLIITLFLTNFVSAQEKGHISGKILDKTNAEELIGVSIMVEGSQTGTVTDIEGKFVLDLTPGNYKLNISYISYASQIITVEVKPGKIEYLNLVMEESIQTLETVIITTTMKKSNDAAVLLERKNAAQVSDGISADLIRRTPDRTTSDVIKRVTGASIQEGKFAVIRGMNDRYNAGYLDGSLLPSTETDRKAFAFDLVPANLVDNLQVIKAGTPDLVGDFGGGVIKINTKSVPEKFTQSISIAGQTQSLTTFNAFTSFKKYPGESLNFLSSKRALPKMEDGALKSPNQFPTTDEKAKFAQTSLGFNHDWNVKNSNAMPNTRASYSLGLPIKLNNGNKIGLILALNYASTQKYTLAAITNFDGQGQTARFKDEGFLQNINTGGLFNLNYVGKKTQISLKNLININTDDNTILRTGTGNITDAVEVRNTSNMYSYNRLYNSILSVKQIVGDNLFNIAANVNYSNINRQLPDYRIVSYTKTPDDEDFKLQLGDFFNSSTGRFNSSLTENLYGGNLEFAKKLGGENIKTELKAGAFYQKRERDFSSRSFVYGGIARSNTGDLSKDLGVGNISPTGLFLAEKTSDDIAYYNGKQNVTAFYAIADQKFFSSLRAVYGVRYEDANIKVTNDKVDLEIADIDEKIFLPSANLSYSLNDKMNLRASYFASVNRPEFRELAPFAFYVFDKNAEIKGNSGLKIAHLNNYDLRYEWYPSANQVISLGGFYKTITNPVEFSIDITQASTTFTYNNEKNAKIYGFEFEFRKNLDFIGTAPFWKDIVVFSNLAVVKSELSFDEGSQAKLNRPLQGQSPYVINSGIQYENEDNGWSGSVVFNQVGRRIAFVGVDPFYGATRQDIYEAPRSIVDAQISKTFGMMNLKFTLGDFLRQDQVFYQDVDDNKKFNAETDRRMFNYINGSTYTLSLGMTF